MGGGRAVLRPGDRVCFDGAEHQVLSLVGTSVRLRDEAGTEQVVLGGYLMAAPDFQVLGGGPLPSVEPVGLLDSLPDEVLAEARRWEQHIVEVETGLAPHAAPGTAPRGEYDPARRSLTERQQAKAAELGVTARTIETRRARYAAQGLWGLVDQRATRDWEATGRADARLVEVVREVIAEQTSISTGTRSRLIRRVVKRVEEIHGPGSGAAAGSHRVLRAGRPAGHRQAHLRFGGHPPADGEPAGRGVHPDVRRPAR
jgi:hypothetical protein